MIKFILVYLLLSVSLVSGEIIFTQNLTNTETTQVKVWLHELQIPDDIRVKVTIHRKSDKIAAIMKQYRSDSLFAQKIVARYWPSDIRFFIDTIAQFKQSENNFDGVWMCFKGDSSCYTKGYYKNNVKDSLWTWKNMDSYGTSQYKNGLLEGESLLYNTKGVLLKKNRYAKGSEIDTTYIWHESGTIQEKVVYKNRKIVLHQCYNEKGKEIECDL